MGGALERAPPGSTNNLSSFLSQGEWSIKIQALVRRLLHLQTTAPNEKCLVFSQVRVWGAQRAGARGRAGVRPLPARAMHDCFHRCARSTLKRSSS